MKKYEFSESEMRFIKIALITLQHEVSDNLRNYDNRELQPSEKNHYLYLNDKLNACNDLIDKLHNWGI